MLRRKSAQLKAIAAGLNEEQKELRATSQKLYNPCEELQSAEYNNAARAFNATLEGEQQKIAMVVTEDKQEEKEAFIAWEELPEEESYLIAYFWVPAAERGQGKGRKMLQEAIEEMKAEGKYSNIKLSADSENMDKENPIELADLVEFYESEGFEVTYAGEIVVMEMGI